METKLELFKNVMYYMFKEGNLPELDMEDSEIMWIALKEHWDIKIENWKWSKFIDEINSSKSENYIWFSEIFNKYFYE